jgi:ATP-dependent Clp protease adaptor protein ClpS
MCPADEPFSTPHGDVLVDREIREPRQCVVIMHNDDYTTMEFVVTILVEVFRKSMPEARAIMRMVHEKGRGICGLYPLEVAETKVAVVHGRAREAGFPLRCTLEVL